MTVSIAVVCEAPADRVTITTLADRLILEAAAQAADWIEGPEALSFYRAWRGFRATDQQLLWTDVKEIARRLAIVATFKSEEPRHPYAQIGLRAVRVLAASPDHVDAMILVPDSDGDLDRLKGLGQARRYAHSALPIAIGLMHTKRECWHIAGFQSQPRNADEQAVVDTLRQELGHDPWLRTHELTAKHDHDRRSAKRVLRELCGDDHDRENECLTAAPIRVLHERGADNGLSAFITELQTHIVPLVLGVPPLQG